ncbi:hypothetical protein ACHAXA_006691 [Cyclostephanos tholiformis]|uniref:Uncharacterized protein n=1 Tax=Cyclostephanos tholiformis TaxID=382380 RepID=A0ABD3RFR5_9STRA
MDKMHAIMFPRDFKIGGINANEVDNRRSRIGHIHTSPAGQSKAIEDRFSYEVCSIIFSTNANCGRSLIERGRRPDSGALRPPYLCGIRET